MRKNHLYITLLLLVGICHAQNKVVPFNDAKISYEGRILNRADAAEMSWPGTSATINFKGNTCPWYAGLSLCILPDRNKDKREYGETPLA